MAFYIYLFANHQTLAAFEPMIRVLIYDSKEIFFKADKERSILVQGISPRYLKVKSIKIRSNAGRVIYSTNNNSSKWFHLPSEREIRISSRDPRGVWLGNRRYGGELRVLKENKNLIVVNHLPVEKYLKSVVASEMPKNWHIEALKAQAIASRTYALNQLKDKLNYDLRADISNQVYLGIEAETPKTARAVDTTRSFVLTYRGKLIDSVYHSNAGGKTASAYSVWGKHKPYLVSVISFDEETPKVGWEKQISNTSLRHSFPKIGGVNAIRILDKTECGRIKMAKLYGPKGIRLLTGKELRRVLLLKSTLFEVEALDVNTNVDDNKISNSISKKSMDNFKIDSSFNKALNSSLDLNSFTSPPKLKGNYSLLIKGNGSGHGVGMSQWGAQIMAGKGYSYRNILLHFYKGARIRRFVGN